MGRYQAHKLMFTMNTMFCPGYIDQYQAHKLVFTMNTMFCLGPHRSVSSSQVGVCHEYHVQGHIGQYQAHKLVFTMNTMSRAT